MKTQKTLRTGIITALMIVVATAVASHAQVEQTETVRNSMTAGSWSMQFRIGENFSLSSFEGSTISLKKHLTDKSALRLGVSVSHTDGDNSTENSLQVDAEYRDDRRDTSWTNSQTDPGNLYGSDCSQSGADVSVMYMYYPAPAKKIKAYLGMGPVIRYSQRSFHSSKDYPTVYNRYDSSAYLNRSQVNDGEQDSWSFGAKLVCGAEWFASSNISFMAEYSLGASYTKTSETRISTAHRTEARGYGHSDITTATISDYNSDRWSIQHSQVKFGISVYF